MYRIYVSDGGVPLTDEIVVGILDRDGKQIVRLSKAL